MKKIFYTVLAASTLGFATSCSEDKGTSTEVASANKDENVDPQHIRDYYGMNRISRMVTQAGPALPQNGQLASDIVKSYYVDNRDMRNLMRQYQFSETALMGGQTNDSTNKDTGASSATDQMEQQSMRTVQDSLNEVTGGANKEDAKLKQNPKPTNDASSKKQLPTSDKKTTKASDKKTTKQ